MNTKPITAIIVGAGHRAMTYAQLAERNPDMLQSVRYVRGETPSLACTSIFDSMLGHMCVYKADQSRENGGLPMTVPSCD